MSGVRSVCGSQREVICFCVKLKYDFIMLLTRSPATPLINIPSQEASKSYLLCQLKVIPGMCIVI